MKKRTFDASGIAKEDVIFIYSGDKLVAEYSTLPPPTNPTTKYVATDTLGSIRAMTNEYGEVVSRRDFMPFGEELQADATYRKANLKYNPDDVRQKFTGYQKDEETGLDFAEARMYNNSHARFTAVDPLLASGKSANPQTFNRYAYVMNSPLKYTDPDGLQAGKKPDKKKEKDYFLDRGQKIPKKGYGIHYYIRAEQNLTGPVEGRAVIATIRVFEDGKPLTPSKAKGVTIEETVERESVTIKDSEGKTVNAPSEIKDKIQAKQTEGDLPLFNEKGQQLGDVQLFAAKSKDADSLKKKEVTETVKTTFTAKINGKPVTSLTIRAKMKLDKIVIDIEDNNEIKEDK